MSEYEITVCHGEECEEALAAEGTTLAQLAMEYQDAYADEIILAKVNGKLRELNKQITGPCDVRFVTVADRDGKRTYRRSVTLLLWSYLHRQHIQPVCLQVLLLVHSNLLDAIFSLSF